MRQHCRYGGNQNRNKAIKDILDKTTQLKIGNQNLNQGHWVWSQVRRNDLYKPLFTIEFCLQSRNQLLLVFKRPFLKRFAKSEICSCICCQELHKVSLLGLPLQCIGKMRSVFAQVLLEHQSGVMLSKPSSRQCRQALCRRLWLSVAAPLPRFSKWVPCLSLASSAITGWYKVFTSTMCKWIALSATRTSLCNVLKSTKYKWRSWSALTTIPPPPFLLPACPTQCKTSS